MTTNIEIDSKKYAIEAGLVSTRVIYDLAGCENRRVFLNQQDEIDIPLDSDSFLIIRGSESFVTGDSPIEDNPPLRNAIQLRLNGELNHSLPKAIITGKELKAFDPEHPKGRLFADISTGPDAEIADDIKIVVQEGNSFFVIPSSDGSSTGDPVDVEDCGKHDRRPPKGQKYRIRIDRDKYTVNEEQITGAQILALVKKELENWSLNQKLRGGERKRIEANDLVDVSQPGIERFETVRRQAQQGRE
ncbi:MAG: multiubiquitin domain-containing protein [Aestuariivita sp.]|nr:multiubiquitin domain-containing protein [Aestuariivita sp.]